VNCLIGVCCVGEHTHKKKKTDSERTVVPRRRESLCASQVHGLEGANPSPQQVSFRQMAAFSAGDLHKLDTAILQMWALSLTPLGGHRSIGEDSGGLFFLPLLFVFLDWL
jgi:hypothetical protein